MFNFARENVLGLVIIGTFTFLGGQYALTMPHTQEITYAKSFSHRCSAPGDIAKCTEEVQQAWRDYNRNHR